MQLHTSGHATEEQLKQVCRLTGAETIIPIHSEYPEKFATFGLNAEIKILHDGEWIEV